MKIKNVTKEVVYAGEYSFAPKQEVDVYPAHVPAVLAVKGLEEIKEKKEVKKEVKKPRKKKK